MRRVGSLWPRVRAFDALCAAAHRAARGQQHAHSTAMFLDRLEPECLRIQRQLDLDIWRPGPTTSFEIHDPKTRTITVTPFEDRVVHHALIAPLEPHFERRMIEDSFACRRGKGMHRALDRAQVFSRRFSFSLKLDVQNFFASLEHHAIDRTLRAIVKDRSILALIARILAGPDGCATRGLPIGSLTSQWFANITLDRLDHWVKETLRVPGYLRYMDDMALFANDKSALHTAHTAIEEFLDRELRLRLEPTATRLAPTACGLPFLGFQVYPRMRRLRPTNLRRARWRLRHRRWQLETGILSEAAYVECVRSLLAHLAHGDTLGLRRAWFRQHRLEL